MLAGLALCRNIKQIRAVAVTGSLALLGLSVYLLVDYLGLRAAGATEPMLYTGSWSWFPQLGINLAVGVDGISIAMIILSAVILLTGSFASWKIDPCPKDFFLWLVLLSTGVFGFFISIDLFTMFMFYEVALIPMYLLIGVWGSGNKNYSAMKLTLMLMGGSASPHAWPHRHLLSRRSHLESPPACRSRCYRSRMAALPLPHDLRRLRCARRHVPLPHMEPRRSCLGSPQQCRCSTPVFS